MLPIINCIGQSLTPLDLLRQQTNAEGFLAHWYEASSAERPAIVCIPGFFTETNRNEPFDGWTDQTLRLAKRYNLSAYGLHWPSQTISDLLYDRDFIKTTNAFMGFGGFGLLGMGALLNPVLMAPILGVGGFALSRFLKTWKKAVQNADDVGQNPMKWLGQINRPIMLVGHSLGGRIALLAAMNTRKNDLFKVITCAPAIFSKQCDFKHINRNVQRETAVLYSKHDMALSVAFRFGEMSLSKPLGLYGVPKEHNSYIRSIDVSTFKGKEIDHREYCPNLDQLLTSGKMKKTMKV